MIFVRFLQPIQLFSPPKNSVNRQNQQDSSSGNQRTSEHFYHGYPSNTIIKPEVSEHQKISWHQQHINEEADGNIMTSIKHMYCSNEMPLRTATYSLYMPACKQSFEPALCQVLCTLQYFSSHVCSSQMAQFPRFHHYSVQAHGN